MLNYLKQNEEKQKAKNNPQIVKNAPHTTNIHRPDEIKAVKNPILKWI